MTASLRSMTPVLHFFHPPPLPWYPPPPSPPPPARGGEILEASVMSTVNPLKSRRRQSGRRLPVHGRPSVAGSSRRVTSEAVPLAGFFFLKAISSVVLHSVVFPQPFISQKSLSLPALSKGKQFRTVIVFDRALVFRQSASPSQYLSVIWPGPLQPLQRAVSRMQGGREPKG